MFVNETKLTVLPSIVKVPNDMSAPGVGSINVFVFEDRCHPGLPATSSAKFIPRRPRKVMPWKWVEDNGVGTL